LVGANCIGIVMIYSFYLLRKRLLFVAEHGHEKLLVDDKDDS
jgi:hypothetical protein